MQRIFRKIAAKISNLAGSAPAFVGAIIVIIVWAFSGPAFGYSDTWQLIINTGTTIVTFLMVFLIQNTQNRDSKAIQLKLDELIRSTKARDEFVDIEELTDHELAALDAEFQEMREKQSTSTMMRKLHAQIEAEHKRRLSLRAGLSHITGQVSNILGNNHKSNKK